MRLPSLALLRQIFRPKLVIGAALVFAACMTFTRFAVQRYIDATAERQLAISHWDFVSTYYETIDYSLGFVANAIIDELGTVTALDQAEMKRLARVYAVDEINLADTNGVWVASSEDDIVGTQLAIAPETAEFLKLLEPDTKLSRISQDFRHSVTHSDQHRKYLGMIFDDRSGLVQLGLDSSRVAQDYERSYGGFVENWYGAGDRRYFVVARRDGSIVECGHEPKTDKKTLAEIGFDMDCVPKDPAKTFRQTLFGEKCRCRAFQYVNYCFFTVIPDSHFEDTLSLSLFISRVLMLAVLVILAILHYNAERSRIEASEHESELSLRRQEDLQMARAIQKSALPAVFPPYPRDFMMDIYACMDPARDVGGDFYDFHYVGSDRLSFLVADVSGKGVPAAMFMMKAKTILQALTLSVADLSDAVAAANDHLCDGNDADMFVTAWIGILDERTGLLRYVNAGHNPPYVHRVATGAIEPLEAVSGLVLGGMKGLRYKTYETRLEPGDLLFLYTDGVTEAHNAFNELFGESRLEEVLRGERGKGLARFMASTGFPSPKTVCRRMRAAVDAFAGQVPQFDDITMLALRYRGLPKTVSLSVPVDLSSVADLNAFAEAELNRNGCPENAKADLLVALDELANNVASYSGGRVMTLFVETARDPSVVRLRLVDDGAPWNPLDHIDPDVTLSVDDREIGGLGILMVKKLMDDVAYVRRDGLNQFSVRKSLEGGASA